MAQRLMDMGELMVVNDTEVGRGARRPTRIEDIQLVRFYLNLHDQMQTPPDGSFDTRGADVMTEEPGLPERIRRFQATENQSLGGRYGYVVADGKVSVPRTNAQGVLGFGARGVYTIRQMGSTWQMYLAAHRAPAESRISAHPLCPPMLASHLFALGA